MDEVQAKNYVDPFVRFNWGQLAAAAWRFHTKHGRGALVIGWDSVRKWVDGEPSWFHPDYATDLKDVPHVAALVQQYDPARQVVIVFEPDDVASTYRLPALAWTYSFFPMPPDAY